MKKKRVIAVHDISCIGRCSLTVALPILSAAGIETSVIPTAVLSTHTGGFPEFTYLDLTDDMQPIIEKWKNLGITADAIYTGYLGSEKQLEIVGNLINDFRKKDTFVLVDPVMGDAGKLYATFDKSFVLGMKKLCGEADMIVPNLTEATMMLDEKYVPSGYSEEYIKNLLTKLSALGPRYCVLSGISFEQNTTGAYAYDSKTGDFTYYCTELIEGFYHGSGDVFASALTGAFMNEKTVGDAMKIAVDFTVRCIKSTHEKGTDTRYGLDFEPELFGYIKSLRDKA